MNFFCWGLILSYLITCHAIMNSTINIDWELFPFQVIKEVTQITYLIDSKIKNNYIAFLSSYNSMFSLYSSQYYDQLLHLTMFDTSTIRIVQNFDIKITDIILAPDIFFHISKIISADPLIIFISYSNLNRSRKSKWKILYR